MDRQTGSDKIKSDKGKMKRKTGRMGRTLSVWMQVNIQGGVGSFNGEAFGIEEVWKTAEFKREIYQKALEEQKAGEQGSEKEEEVLSLWWKCHQTQ